MTRGWATTGIVALAAVAVVLGLVLTGGPGHARKQKRDMQREQDLIALASVVDCVAQQRQALPDSTDPTESCNWDARQTDPQTQAPYRYQVTAPDQYRICAEFELPPQRPLDRWGRDAQGCISREFKPRD